MTDKLKIIQFKKPDSAPREDVIKAIEGMLEKAKSGEISAVYIAALCEDKSVASCFSSTDDYFKAVGAIEWLKKRVLENA